MAESEALQTASSREELDDLLASLQLEGLAVVGAGWSEGLRDFQVELSDGRGLLFVDAIQVNLQRPLAAAELLAFGGYWTDEPSPVLLALDPAVRFRYHHLVFELGDGLLRVACRALEAGRLDDAVS